MAAPDDTCSECCTCSPSFRVEYKSLSRSKSKPAFCGFRFRCSSGDAWRYFLTRVTRTDNLVIETAAGYDGPTPPTPPGGIGNWFYGPSVGFVWGDTSITGTCTSSGGSIVQNAIQVVSGIQRANITGSYHPTSVQVEWAELPQTADLDTCDITDGTPTAGPSLTTTAVYEYGVDTQTYSDEISEAAAKQSTSGLIAEALDELADDEYGGTWTEMDLTHEPTGFRNVSPDEETVTLRRSIYRIRMQIPDKGYAPGMRLTWIERFVPEGGTFISSSEIVSPGVLRSPVTLAAPPAGGRQAHAIAVMGTGSPITVAAIRVTNPGWGYTTPPPVTVYGGVYNPTGWTATLDAYGRVTGISGGIGRGGTPASHTGTGGSGGTAITATVTKLDALGGVAEVSIAGPGNLTDIPNINFGSLLSGMVAPTLRGHMGTETLRCATWDGVVPEDYDPEDSATWPLLTMEAGFFELGAPGADGTTSLEDFRTFCDTAACP